jgi:hypothetical protein
MTILILLDSTEIFVIDLLLDDKSKIEALARS